MAQPRADVGEWKKLRDYVTILERASTSKRQDPKPGATRQQKKALSDVISADDDSFGVAVRGERMKSLGRGSVDGSFAQPRYSADAEERYEKRQRSAADAAGWKRSLKSNDVTLDKAVSKVKELISRRRQLEKWLMQVRFAQFTC